MGPVGSTVRGSDGPRRQIRRFPFVSSADYTVGTHVTLAPSLFSQARMNWRMSRIDTTARPLLCLGLLLGFGTWDGWSSRSALADETESLVESLPSTANMVGVIRVADIHATPRAQRENWAADDEHRFLAGATVVPSWVNTLVVGSLVRPAVPEEVWTAAVAVPPSTVTMDQIAEHEQSSIEQLAGHDAVRGLRDMYIVELSDKLIGAMRPAVRQETARWVREIDSASAPGINEYLKEVARRPSHIVFGLNMQDMLDPQRVKEHIEADKQFSSSPQLPQELAALVTGLRGISFAANIEDRTVAEITLDFEQEVGAEGMFVKPLLLSVLNDMGAAIDDFERADVVRDGKSVVMSTVVSDESLRRIMSILLPPQTGAGATPEPVAATPPPAAVSDPSDIPSRVNGKASQRYFKAVTQIIRDLERANRRATDISRTASWHDNFADKIDNLPVAGVDRVLIDWGTDVSRHLRALAASLRGQSVALRAQQNTLTYDYKYQGGAAAVNVWGGVGYREPTWRVTSNLQQVRERQAKAVTAGAQEREQIWLTINNSTVDVRGKMQAKYGDDFS